MRKFKFSPMKIEEHLDSEEAVTGYLTAALEDPNPEIFLHALSDVAKARGMATIAKRSGLGRESLYKALAPGAKPRYETVRKLMDALGVKLVVSAANAG
jgi:probable addiction module antidote protein